MFADWNEDGTADLIVGSESDGVALWTTVPTDSGFSLRPQADLLPDAPTFAVPARLDADRDGDPDLFLGGIGGGVFLYENLVR